MKKILTVFTFFATSFVYLLSPSSAHAVCPVCTVAVIGGLGLSRFLGIDDSISGVWIGGLMLSISFWSVDWIIKKGYLKKLLNKVNSNILIGAFYLILYAITFIPMFMTNFIGHPVNKIWGIDKLVFGSIVGTIFFLIGFIADKKERQIKGKQLFQFQRVVFPVIALLIASIILYIATK